MKQKDWNLMEEKKVLVEVRETFSQPEQLSEEESEAFLEWLCENAGSAEAEKAKSVLEVILVELDGETESEDTEEDELLEEWFAEERAILGELDEEDATLK